MSFFPMVAASTGALRERRQTASRSFADGSRSAAAGALSLLLALSLATACSAPRPPKAASIQPAFPRLAVWWPDPSRQTAARLARFDWIALQDQDADHITGLRAANPSILILGSTNARELDYRVGDYDDPVNIELRSVPTDWMLTQVGSTLTSDITASSTAVPVADVSRFAVGEMVLCDHELMYVRAISGSSLTVATRGPVDPPAPHATGARIASVVSVWPGSITMDLSTACPKRDVGHGPEMWSDWNVRRGRAVLDAAGWDGLLIDCLESNPSWMVASGKNRSIDPSRTNTPVADGYAAFDSAWNAGATAYGNALRAVAGDKLLIGNGNLRNYRLNGNIFEEFPYAGLPLSTWNVVFAGPYSAPHASYPEWCADAAARNLTSIQTYGRATDYRLMRFGLCSALMNDGYFLYALSSTGHARSGLYWFDEYDDAGAGRGYLGRPTGVATQVGGAWRRDYDNGIALVNPSDDAVTVQLGGTFRKIKGAQDPTVNDGSTVTSATIPPQDGLILLRTGAVR